MTSEQISLMQQMQQAPPPQSIVKQMAYGGSSQNAVNAGNLYRVERGTPIMRAGRYVPTTPQFRSLPLNSPVQQQVQVAKAGQYSNSVAVIQSTNSSQSNSQVTGTVNSPISVTYPAQIKA